MPLHFFSRAHTVVHTILLSCLNQRYQQWAIERKRLQTGCWTMLHLQRSGCGAIACNANVPEVPHSIAFKRAAIDNEHDEDQWELHSNDDESFERSNDNTDKANAKTDKIIGIGANDDSDDDNEMYDNDSSQHNSSGVDSFHKDGLVSCSWISWKLYKKEKTVLEERIEEYILQGITEEFNPSFNEDFLSETPTNMNIGYGGVTSESIFSIAIWWCCESW